MMFKSANYVALNQEINRLKKPEYKRPYYVLICTGVAFCFLGLTLFFLTLFLQSVPLLIISIILMVLGIAVVESRLIFIESLKNYKMKVHKIEDNSRLIKELNKINNELNKMLSKNKSFKYTYRCLSEYEKLTFDFTSFLIKKIKLESSSYATFEENYENALCAYKNYMSNYLLLPNLAIKEADCTFGVSYDEVRKYEDSYYKNKKICTIKKPCVEITIEGIDKSVCNKIFSFERVVNLINNIQPPIMTAKRRKEKEDHTFVESHSTLIHLLKKLNMKYISDYELNKNNICKRHDYEYKCKSKREYDLFIFEKNLLNIIRENIEYYKKFKQEFIQCTIAYEKYYKEYEHLLQFTVDENSDIGQVSFKKYKAIEEELYIKRKLPEPIEPHIRITKKYKTPQGRHSYTDSKTFTLVDIERFIDEAQKTTTSTKPRLSQTQLAKEKAKLEKKQAELTAREQEFILATQNHLYSPIEEQQTYKHNDKLPSETDSLYIKLRMLKQELDCGLISFEEYSKRRNEIIR